MIDINTLFIISKSLTNSQRMERCLEKAGIGCTITRLQGRILGTGCGYTLKVRAQDIIEAIRELHRCGIRQSKVFKENDDGGYEEYKYDIP